MRPLGRTRAAHHHSTRKRHTIPLKKQTYLEVTMFARLLGETPGRVIERLLHKGEGTMKRALSIVALLALAGGRLAAQTSTQSASATASITVLSPVTFAKSVDLSFGSHFPSEGVISCSACTPARWDGLGSAGHNVDVTFTLPSVLTRVGNSATVPITFGNSSALFTPDGSAAARFDPAGGLFGFTLTGSGGFSVQLGAAVGGASDDVMVNITGAPGGVYQATIVATVVQH